MSSKGSIRKLGELADLITKGTTPTSIGYKFAREGVNFLKIESIGLHGQFIPEKLDHISPECHAALKRSQLQSGDILFSIAGALGRTAMVPDEILPANTNQALAIVRLMHSREVVPAYVLLALSSGFVLEQVERNRGGVAQQNLSLAQVASFEIPLPDPEKQRRIVAILNKAFECIAVSKINAEKNLQNAREVFASQLDYEIHERGKTWEFVRLGSIVDRLTNGYVGPTRDIYKEEGVPYLLARHVKNNQLRFDGKTFVGDAFNAKHKKSILKAGDVLLVQSGHVGHSAVVPPSHEGHNCHAMIVISPKLGTVTGHFLSLYFSSPGVQHEFEGMHTGSTLKHLNCGDVKEMRVPVPSTAEQDSFVSKFERIAAETQRLESIYQRKLAGLADLRGSLLHQAFSGQL
jgi:type I restriction enzyme, S subunit